MHTRLLDMIARDGLGALGAAMLRRAADAEARHRADAARQHAHDLTLYREDSRVAHGCARQPAPRRPRQGRATLHTEVPL